MKSFTGGFVKGDRVFCCSQWSAFYKDEFEVWDFDHKRKKILCISGDGPPFSFRKEELKRLTVDARENSKN